MPEITPDSFMSSQNGGDITPDSFMSSPEPQTPAVDPAIKAQADALFEKVNPQARFSPGYMGVPTDSRPYDFGAVGRGAVRNAKEFLAASEPLLRSNPEAGGYPVQPDGTLTQPPTQSDVERFMKAADAAIVPVSEGAQDPLSRGVMQGLESLTSPTNLAIGAATGGLGAAARLAEVGLSAVGIRTANAALSAYFAYQMGHGATEAMRKAYGAYQEGDLDGAAQYAGAGTVEGLLALAGIAHTAHNVREIGRARIPFTQVPEEPAEPAGLAPAPPPGAGPVIDIDPNAPAPAKPDFRSPHHYEPKPNETEPQPWQPAKAPEDATRVPTVPMTRVDIPGIGEVEFPTESLSPDTFMRSAQPQASEDKKDNAESSDLSTAVSNDPGAVPKSEADNSTVETSTPEAENDDFKRPPLEEVQKEIAERYKYWPALNEHQNNEPNARPTDPKLGDIFPFGDQGKEIVLVHLWRTASAKESDGKLHVTFLHPKHAAEPERGFVRLGAERLPSAKPIGNVFAERGLPIPEHKYEAPPAEPEKVDAEEKPTETLAYRNKGNHKINIYLKQTEDGWHHSVDYNLQGQQGGTNGSYRVLPTREAAIADAIRNIRRNLAQTVNQESAPAKIRDEAARMVKWLDAQTEAPKSDKPTPAAIGDNRVVYFSGHHNEKLAATAARRGDIGLMVTPLKPDYLKHATKYPVIAIDNGAFSKKTPFSETKFMNLVKAVHADPEIKKRVRFVVAPDVVGNGKKTLENFSKWADVIHSYGLPVALAAQDGVEYLQHDIPWDKIDVLFIGGSTDWKTGAHIDKDKYPRAARERWNALWNQAHERGIPIHMGRVNSGKRLDLAEQGIGATSVDGTYLVHGPTKNQPSLENWLDKQNTFGRQQEHPNGAEVPDSSQPDEDDYKRGQKQAEQALKNAKSFEYRGVQVEYAGKRWIVGERVLKTKKEAIAAVDQMLRTRELAKPSEEELDREEEAIARLDAEDEAPRREVIVPYDRIYSYDKKGDIGASYSADVFEHGKVRKPFEFEGKLWVSTSKGGGGGAGAYPLIPRSEYQGEPRPAKSLRTVQGAELGYEGILVKYHGSEYVIGGPEVNFISQEEKDDNVKRAAAMAARKTAREITLSPAAQKAEAEARENRDQFHDDNEVAEKGYALGHETTVIIPGEDIEIPAQYAIVDRKKVQASHTTTFQPNPEYGKSGVKNERRYQDSVNQQRVIEQADETKFKERLHITDNPDAVNGPGVYEAESGDALAGNSRKIALDMIFERGGAALARYQKLLLARSEAFGIDPKEWAAMDEPMLARIVRRQDLEALPGGSKWAVRKTNIAGTAALSSVERTMSDAEQLTPELIREIGGVLDEAGEDSTLSAALSGKRGAALVNELIAQRFFNENERPQLMNEKTGAVTQLAKDRIAKALLGRFFPDSDQLQRFPEAVKNKLERIAVPLVALADDPAWDLTPDIREAIDLIEYAQAHDLKSPREALEHVDMFGSNQWGERAITLAELLAHGKPNSVLTAFRDYVAMRVDEDTRNQSAFPGFEPPPPPTAEEAFVNSFGGYGGTFLADLADNGDARHTPAERLAKHGWYSQMAHVIEAKMPGKVSPAQALAILENPQNGVKPDELKWTDIREWLARQTGPLTKQDILDRANQNLLTVREVHVNRSGNSANSRYAKYVLKGKKENYTELLFTVSLPAKEWRALSELRDKLNAKYGKEGDAWLRASGADPLTPEERAAWDHADKAWEDSDEYKSRPIGYSSPHWSERNVVAHTRFDTRTDLKGRKVLFVEEIQSDWHQAGREKGYRDESENPGNFASWLAAHHPEVTEREMDQAWMSGAGYSLERAEQRGADPRYIQWRRAFERWNENQHKVPQAPFAKNWHELVFRRLIRHAAENGYDAVAWTTGKQQASRYDLSKHVAAVAWQPITDPLTIAHYRKTSAYANEEDREPGWLLMQTKHARENGLDWERAKTEAVTRGELPDFLGKEVAKKLLEQPPVALDDFHGTPTDFAHQLAGKTLQIGGHGMSGFYDQILPAFAKKFGKKWGVEPTTAHLANWMNGKYTYEGPEYSLAQLNKAIDKAFYSDARNLTESPLTGKRLVHTTEGYGANYISNLLRDIERRVSNGEAFGEAVAAVAKQQGGQQFVADILGGQFTSTSKRKLTAVHSLDINEPMKLSVMRGQPLFSRKLKGDSYSPDKQYAPGDIVDAADWDVYPATLTRPQRIRLNWQAAQILGNAWNMQFNGVAADPTALKAVARRLELRAHYWQEQNLISEAATETVLRLAADVMRLGVQGPAYLYREAEAHTHHYAGNPGDRMKAVWKSAATQREELTHMQQGVFAKGWEDGEHLTPEQVTTLKGFEYWPQIKRELDKLGYDGRPEQHHFLEASAKLMAGKLLNIPERIANGWLELYFKAIRDTHGLHAAQQVFRYALPQYRPKPSWNKDYADQTRPAQPEAPALHRGQRNSASLQPPASPGRYRSLGDLFGDEEQPDLFSSDTKGEIEEALRGHRAAITRDRLTAQFNSPITRDEQKKKLKRSQEKPQQDLFGGGGEEPPQGSLFDRDEEAQYNALKAFWKHELEPKARDFPSKVAEIKDDVLKLLAPAARVGAEPGALSIRQRAAEMARSTDQARIALEDAKKYFDRKPDNFNFNFIDWIENGEDQPLPELQQFADIMRQILDTRREAIQALGTGKLQNFIENYFPHIWKNPDQAQQFFANWTKRPLEGAKSFLKKRSIATFADGIAAGLEPVSNNPVELVLAKAREMDKYITAHRILKDLKQQDLLRFFDARNANAPAGWKKIDDPVATVYGPSIQSIPEYPNEGLWNGLQAAADALGVKHERGFVNIGDAVGRAYPNKDHLIRTKHGSAEDVIAHELGHQIDWLAGSGKKFVTEYPSKEMAERLQRLRKSERDMAASPESRTAARKELKDLHDVIQDRKAFAQQLRDLADLRGGRPEYTRKREEKMALLAQLWASNRDLFKQTAPKVYALWKQFLNENPKLHPLRDLAANAKITATAQPYDVGGLVIKGHWWGPEPVVRLVNNYLSPGLREQSSVFRAYLGVANFLNQLQLGFSAFHLGFTTFDVGTSKLALGLYQAMHGDYVAAAKSAAMTIPELVSPITGAAALGARKLGFDVTDQVAPFSNLVRGDKLLAEWYRPGTQGEQTAALIDAVIRAGGRAKMDGFYETQITKHMLEAWRKNNVFGALLRLPGAAVELFAKPIMDYVVPRQKLGVFADLAHYEMERLGPDADAKQLQAALARAWDSVDNRLGQLVYDNLFWNKVIKDLAMGSVRSVGWNVGTHREIGGGLADAGAFAKAKFGGGEGDITPRISYIVALPILVGLLGAVAYYLAHGHAPKHLRDYYAPNGYMLPSYMKDVFGVAHDPVSSAKGKIHPLLTLILDMLSNKDYANHPIANPNHPATKRWRERVEYILRQAAPIAYRDDRKHHKQTAPERALEFVGIKRAPKYLRSPQQ